MKVRNLRRRAAAFQIMWGTGRRIKRNREQIRRSLSYRLGHMRRFFEKSTKSSLLIFRGGDKTKIHRRHIGISENDEPHSVRLKIVNFPFSESWYRKYWSSISSCIDFDNDWTESDECDYSIGWDPMQKWTNDKNAGRDRSYRKW